jgi:hypothetical protein
MECELGTGLVPVSARLSASQRAEAEPKSGALVQRSRCDVVHARVEVDLADAQYEVVRQIPTHFFVVPGHQGPEIERVFEKRERYFVVEQFGEGGRPVVRLDRRRQNGEMETSDPRY